jgi:hypothetical protein
VQIENRNLEAGELITLTAETMLLWHLTYGVALRPLMTRYL